MNLSAQGPQFLAVLVGALAQDGDIAAHLVQQFQYEIFRLLAHFAYSLMPSRFVGTSESPIIIPLLRNVRTGSWAAPTDRIRHSHSQVVQLAFDVPDPSFNCFEFGGMLVLLRADVAQ
jgi:hypothetical protein